MHSDGNEEFAELPDGRKIYFKDLRHDTDTETDVEFDQFRAMALQKLWQQWQVKLGRIVQINMRIICDDTQFCQIGLGIYLGNDDFLKIHISAQNAGTVLQLLDLEPLSKIRLTF